MLERMEKQNRIFSGFDADAIDRTTAADLAEVGSDKWTRYPGCIGAFIAEMDYGLAPCIQQAIDSACDHCKLGYIPEPWKRRVAEACAGWQKSHYGWDVDPDIIRVVPDVLEAYEIFLRELVGAGNAVVVPTPAYMPFLSVPKLYDVDVIEIEMLQGTDETTGEREWLFDFDAIERAFAAGCHAFVLCNPHNPIGKVLTLAEEQRLCELAERYDVRIFNDEIHAPFVFEGRHIPYPTISEAAARQSMTATSASKSFNIPGTKCAQVLLTNPADREMWAERAEWSEHQTATIGAIATTTAYNEGDPWFQDALSYVRRNLGLFDKQMRTRFSGVGYIRPRGTYIAWLDFGPLGIDDPAAYFLEKAKVALTDGRSCGRAGTWRCRIRCWWIASTVCMTRCRRTVCFKVFRLSCVTDAMGGHTRHIAGKSAESLRLQRLRYGRIAACYDGRTPPSVDARRESSVCVSLRRRLYEYAIPLQRQRHMDARLPLRFH